MYLYKFVRIVYFLAETYLRIKKKTERRSSVEELKTAADSVVKCGKSIRSAAAEFNVDRMTLLHFMAKQRASPERGTGYERCKTVNTIFSTAMEAHLAIHVKDMARRFYGLSKEKCCCLICEYAE